MNNRCALTNFLLVILLLINCIGMFFIVDSNDLMRKEMVRLQEMVQDGSGQRVIVRNSAASDNGEPQNRQETRFANEEFRDPEAVDGGREIVQTSAFSGNLNTMVNNDAACSQVWGYCNDGVATRNLANPMKWEPLLADSWEISADGMVYTIHLRKGVMWHPVTDPVTEKRIPPREMTADDFVFYWELIRNPNVLNGQLKGYWEKCKSIEAIDRYTLRITWADPYSMAEVWSLGINPMPRHYYQPEPLPAMPVDPEKDPEGLKKYEEAQKEFALKFNESRRNYAFTGVGAYRFKEWDRDRNRIVLERWEQYYGLKPHIKTIVLRVQANPEVALIEFEKGEYDQISIHPSKWKDRTAGPEYYTVTPDAKTVTEDSIAHDQKKKAGLLPKEYKFERYQQNGGLWRYIGWNMSLPMFKDGRVRVALTHLVDRNRIINEVYWNLAKPITGPFVPRSGYYDKSIEPWPFDIAEAKRRLKEAGWEDTDGDGRIDKDLDGDGKRDPFIFTLTYSASSPDQEQISQIVKDDFSKAGIEVNLKSIEWSLVSPEIIVNRNYQAMILGWVGGFEGDPYQVWHSSSMQTGGSNYVFWDNRESDRLIEEGRVTMNKEKRCKIYHQFHRLLHEQQPYTFLAAPMSLFAIDRRYRNVRIYEAGSGDMWTPKDEQKMVP